MRHLGVSTLTWSTNLAATASGLLIWSVGRRQPPPGSRATRAFLTTVSLAAILLPFASEGVSGVHRWVPAAGVRLHASAMAAPVIIFCVAAAAALHRVASALAISATAGIILALQPDAAQATSVAAACAVVIICRRGTMPRRQVMLTVVLLLAVSAASFIRHDPLPPVAHVEGILTVVASGGIAQTAMATAALLLLPAPFFVAWYRHRRSVALAPGVYVAMTLLAPAWGTFPVPVMGYGVSPILGYFIALVAGVGGPSRLEESSQETLSSSPAQRRRHVR